MALTRCRRIARLVAALAVVCFGLLVFASAHADVAHAATAHDSASCPPETATCTQATFPSGATATAGPVTNVGQDQAVYVEVTGVPVGDELEVAYCSLAAGTQVVAEPQCGSQNTPTNPSPNPYEYQYGVVTSQQTILSMPTEYDPDIPGAQPLVSQTNAEYQATGEPTGSFFCDNASNPCGVEVMEIGGSNPEQYVIGNGYPPGGNPPYSAVGNTVVFPLTFNLGGTGCGSAPIMQVDASYSVAQFLPVAGEGTCNGPGGVAAIATDLPSVDDPGCASGTGTHCPIYDVIDGNVPVSFTDDPEDPATVAELKQAGGSFAYIPIALSGTEIAFKGGAAVAIQGNATLFPLDSYQLTPATAAGVMTQQWTAATASLGVPNDDVCGELSGGAKCKQKTVTSSSGPILVESANGKTDNLDVSAASSTTPVTKSFPISLYEGNFANGAGETIGGGSDPKKNFSADTGYTLLNPWPFSFQGQTVDEFSFGAMWPSTASGATFESTQWMCNAPNSTYSVNFPWGGQANVHDFLSGQQLLANAEQDPVAAPDNTNGLQPGVVDDQVPATPNTCQAVSTLPVDLASQGSVDADLYEPSSQPITAAHAMQSAAAAYGSDGGFAFGAMDSSEADFFGLLPASLENATGSLVAPSAASLEAAVTDATTNSDGTITPNWNDTGDSAAYPMPMVTYALVSTSAQPAGIAAELKDLLTNLVTYSNEGGTTADPLPPGYAPLPTSLYNVALSDISSDITGPGAPGPGSGGSGGSGGTGGTSSPSSAAASATSAAASPGGSSAAPGGGGGRAPGAAGHPSTRTSAASAAVPAGSSGSSSPGAFAGHLITVTVGDSRFFVPGLLVLALLCLIVGPLLYLSPNLRKRLGVGAAADVPEAAASGSGSPEGG